MSYLMNGLMPDLLSDIQLFCETHGLSISRFGELALNDKGFVHQLADNKKPRRVWPETEAKVRRFMATYKPEPEEKADAA